MRLRHNRELRGISQHGGVIALPNVLLILQKKYLRPPAIMGVGRLGVRTEG